QLGLVARLLVLARGPVRLASRLLGPVPGGLGLGTRPLRLEPPGLRLRRGILGPRHPASRAPLRAGRLPAAGLPPAEIYLHPQHRDRRDGPNDSLLRPAGVSPLLLRRLLRSGGQPGPVRL